MTIIIELKRHFIKSNIDFLSDKTFHMTKSPYNKIEIQYKNQLKITFTEMKIYKITPQNFLFLTRCNNMKSPFLDVTLIPFQVDRGISFVYILFKEVLDIQLL